MEKISNCNVVVEDDIVIVDDGVSNLTAYKEDGDLVFLTSSYDKRNKGNKSIGFTLYRYADPDMFRAVEKLYAYKNNTDDDKTVEFNGYSISEYKKGSISIAKEKDLLYLKITDYADKPSGITFLDDDVAILAFYRDLIRVAKIKALDKVINECKEDEKGFSFVRKRNFNKGVRARLEKETLKSELYE